MLSNLPQPSVTFTTSDGSDQGPIIGLPLRGYQKRSFRTWREKCYPAEEDGLPDMGLSDQPATQISA
jgi:hypothetical protein